jgi:hypothetical protein
MATAPKSEYPSEKKGKSATADEGRREFWSEQISKAQKRWEPFQTDGDAVLDRFMLESSRGADKYNILYSSTETIKPSLYGQTPKVAVKTRNQDTEDTLKIAAAMLLEQIGQYAVDMLDFDYVLQNAVSDYVLPGLGTVWVRYDPKFTPAYDNDNKPKLNAEGKPEEYLTFEGLALDYVHFKDILYGPGRFWHEIPWVARRVFYTKKQARERFGKEKANQLSYTYNAQDRKDRKDEAPKRQAIIYEIWDKEGMEVVFFSEDYPDDLLETKPDPLRLTEFFPCPRPMRAVWSTRTFVPKALYSQYKAQAAELDRLTERIRYLTEALKVRGLYDGSQENLANVLDGPGNKMIPVQDWSSLMGNGGIVGSVQWVPLKDVVQCLTELFKQREICKNEIYEITGFSDIVRGISKASETLGAQQIKADWATGRLKDMQREVQRFIRDIIRIFVEIAAEHFNEKSLLLYSGLSIPEPTPQEIQAKQQYPQMVQQAQMQGQPPPPPPPPTQGEIVRKMFDAVVKIVRADKLRCAAVGIETDSTILPDEQKERQDRMAFLSSMGAFLQQSAPLALQYPDMRGLLGGIMMFTLRTFSASRPLEKEFEEFQKKLAQQPPMPPPGTEDKQGKAEALKAQQQQAQMKTEADKQTAAQSDATKRYEIDQRTNVDKMKAAQDHEYRMAQLQIERDKVQLEKTKLGLQTMAEERDVDTARADKASEQADAMREQMQAAADKDADRADADIDRGLTETLENRKLDLQEDAQAQAAEQAAQEPTGE